MMLRPVIRKMFFTSGNFEAIAAISLVTSSVLSCEAPGGKLMSENTTPVSSLGTKAEGVVLINQ